MITTTTTNTNTITHNTVNKKFCTNCGKHGHLYKYCKYPVISLGIIAFKVIDTSVQVLLVQRKDTLSFVEFMRGKYDLNNLNKLNIILPKLTYKEVNKLLTYTFDELWLELWNIKHLNNLENRYKKEYKYSKNNFNILKNGYFLNNEFVSLELILNNIKSFYTETEWGFPKGRRNYKENNLNCGIREFCEETNYKKEDLILLDELPLKEKFKGTNNINYEHIYYLSIYKSNEQPFVNKENIEQMKEINDVKWFSFEEAYNIIRDYNIEKKNTLEQAFTIFMNKIKK